MTKTLRVHLADAPTDVLVWLVAQPSNLWWSVGQIAAATAPDDAVDAQATVASALSLLWRMGYVVRSSAGQGWGATVDGQNAVEAATSTNPVPLPDGSTASEPTYKWPQTTGSTDDR